MTLLADILWEEVSSKDTPSLIASCEDALLDCAIEGAANLQSPVELPPLRPDDAALVAWVREEAIRLGKLFQDQWLFKGLPKPIYESLLAQAQANEANKMPPKTVGAQLQNAINAALRIEITKTCSVETVAAQQLGIHVRLLQAVEEGVIDPEQYKVQWITSPKCINCPNCFAQHENKTAIGQPFYTRDYQAVFAPPLCYNCGCSVHLVPVPAEELSSSIHHNQIDPSEFKEQDLKLHDAPLRRKPRIKRAVILGHYATGDSAFKIARKLGIYTGQVYGAVNNIK